jgi:protein-S-isoprenylcysteine O-methyltransferase Ste14
VVKESVDMIYIVLGGLGFLIIHLLDIDSIKKIRGLKPLTTIIGNGLIVFPIVMLCLSADKLALPAWTTVLGWILLPVSLFMLIYSLYINLPMGKTYFATGVGEKLVTRGLYALVRHPWLHWLVLMLLALIMVSRSSPMLIAAPIWVALDIGLVIIQDRFFFGKMFAGYDKYRRQTPMFIPNRRSLNAFINSLKQNAE